MQLSRHAHCAAVLSAILILSMPPDTRAGAPAEGPPPTVVLKGHAADLAGADFSPDGTKVVTASSDHSARIWDAKTGAVLATLGGHSEGVRSASFSPDGTRVLTAARDGSAKIWDAGSGELIKTLSGHSEMLEYAAFSSDGSHIVTASRDERATVWDAKTGEAVADLTGHKGPVMRAAFDADGMRVITASADKTGRIWAPWMASLRPRWPDILAWCSAPPSAPTASWPPRRRATRTRACGTPRRVS